MRKFMILMLAVVLVIWCTVYPPLAFAEGEAVPGGGTVVGLVIDESDVFYAIELADGSIVFAGPFGPAGE